MADAVNDNEVSMTALRNHLEADMMHDALRADVLSAMLVGLGKSTSSQAEVRSSIEEHAAHFREVLGENLKLPVNDTLKAGLNKIKPSLDTYISAAERIVGLALENPDAAQKELGTFNSAFSQLEDQMAALSELIETNTQQTSAGTQQAISNANLTLGSVLVASLLLLLAQGRWVILSIMGPLQTASRIAESIAHGNLSEPIVEPTRNDEASALIRSLATMQRDLRGMIEVVRSNAHGVSGMSDTVEQWLPRSRRQQPAAKRRRQHHGRRRQRNDREHRGNHPPRRARTEHGQPGRGAGQGWRPGDPSGGQRHGRHRAFGAAVGPGDPHAGQGIRRRFSASSR